MANHEQGRLPEPDERETPAELFQEKHSSHHFDLDAAASHSNTQCATYFTKDGLFQLPVENGMWQRAQLAPAWPMTSNVNGLTGLWLGRRVWFNPPYSDIAPWIEKAWDSGADLAYGLVPNWTDRNWWQDYVEPFRDNGFEYNGLTLKTEFMKRHRFLYQGLPIRTKDGKIGQPEFGLVGLLWQRKGST